MTLTETLPILQAIADNPKAPWQFLAADEWGDGTGSDPIEALQSGFDIRLTPPNKAAFEAGDVKAGGFIRLPHCPERPILEVTDDGVSIDGEGFKTWEELRCTEYSADGETWTRCETPKID